jgi:hypothetical protein
LNGEAKDRVGDDPESTAGDVTAENIEHAKAAAQRDGSPLLNALLNAESEAGRPES